jgi:hypothetical protein
VSRDITAERAAYRASIDRLRNPQPVVRPAVPTATPNAGGGHHGHDPIFGFDARMIRRREWRIDPDFDPSVWS